MMIEKCKNNVKTNQPLLLSHQYYSKLLIALSMSTMLFYWNKIMNEKIAEKVSVA